MPIFHTTNAGMSPCWSAPFRKRLFSNFPNRPSSFHIESHSTSICAKGDRFPTRPYSGTRKCPKEKNLRRKSPEVFLSNTFRFCEKHSCWLCLEGGQNLLLQHFLPLSGTKAHQNPLGGNHQGTFDQHPIARQQLQLLLLGKLCKPFL